MRKVDFAKNPDLSSLLLSLKREQTWKDKSFSAWDLALVLETLASKEFEVVSDPNFPLKLLTGKQFFSLCWHQDPDARRSMPCLSRGLGPCPVFQGVFLGVKVEICGSQAIQGVYLRLNTEPF